MSTLRLVLELHDLDQMLDLARDPACRDRLARVGYGFDGLAGLEREREKLVASLDRRYSVPYERSRGRYGRGVTLVRDRTCQGCFLRQPTSAAPPPGESVLHLCVGCGRLLYWR